MSDGNAAILNTVLDESKFQDFNEEVVSEPYRSQQNQIRIARPQTSDVDYLLFYLCVQAVVFYGLGTIIGFLKKKTNAHVSISRKIFCMLFFSISFIIPRIAGRGYIDRSLLILATTTMTALLVMSLSRRIRKHFRPSRLVFEAISRPGEHSQTIKWLTTESVATSLIIYIAAPVMERIWSNNFDQYLLFLIPAIASGFSDAAAEIIGSRWGRRKYPAFGFFVKKEFYRTLEGSLAFFVVTALFSFIFFLLLTGSLNSSGLWCLILMPFTLTIAEAISPHTWDNPIIYSTGYLTIYLVHAF